MRDVGNAGSSAWFVLHGAFSSSWNGCRIVITAKTDFSRIHTVKIYIVPLKFLRKLLGLNLEINLKGAFNTPLFHISNHRWVLMRLPASHLHVSVHFCISYHFIQIWFQCKSSKDLRWFWHSFQLTSYAKANKAFKTSLLFVGGNLRFLHGKSVSHLSR